MLPKLIVIGLYTFLCSAIELEGFKDVTGELEHSQVLYQGMSANLSLAENIDKLKGISQCAKACLDAKYLCKVFIVTSLPTNRLQCRMFKIPASQLIPVPVSTVGSSVIFETFEPEPIEPVIERFLYDYKMPEDYWAGRLVNGYCLAGERICGFLPHIITACKTAMYSEPARAIDFERWTLMRDISEAQRPISELEALKIMEGVKSWEEYSQKTKLESSGSFATILLTFLDIFCPHIRRGTTTIYDPIERVLFIDNEDIHILVATFGPGDYAIVRDQLKSRDNSEVLVCLTQLESLGDITNSKTAVDLFQQAKNLKTTTQYSGILRSNSGSDEQLHAIRVLVNVLQSLIKPELGLVSYRFPSPSSLTFYRDLVPAVLSHIYGKKDNSRIISAFNTRLQSKKFSDISLSFQK